MKANRLIDVLAVCAVGVLVLLLFQSDRRIRAQRMALDEWRETVTQRRFIDGIVGSELAAAHVRTIDGEVTDLRKAVSGRTLWVLAPGECPGCLNNLGGWTDAGNAGVILMTGVGLSEATALKNAAGLRTTILVDSARMVPTVAGLTAPSVFLLLDKNLVVLSADARSARTPCQWSFLAQVQSIRANEAAVGLVRSSATGGSSEIDEWLAREAGTHEPR